MKLIINTETLQPISRKDMMADFEESYFDAHEERIEDSGDDYVSMLAAFIEMGLDDECICLVDADLYTFSDNELPSIKRA